jgi:hypothetical protein
MDDFERQMRDIASRVKRDFSNGVKHTMDVVQETVIRGTPVKTGRARNGWDVAEGAPNRRSPQMVGPFDDTGEYRIVENRKVIKAAPEDGDLNFYLENTVPYVPELNRGSSEQAPRGFVEIAMSVGIQEAKKIKVL